MPRFHYRTVSARRTFTSAEFAPTNWTFYLTLRSETPFQQSDITRGSDVVRSFADLALAAKNPDVMASELMDAVRKFGPMCAIEAGIDDGVDQHVDRVE